MPHLRSLRLWPLVVVLATALGMTLLVPPQAATAALTSTTTSGWSTTTKSVTAGYALRVPVTVTTGGRAVARTVSVQRKLSTSSVWSTTSTVATSSTGSAVVSLVPPTAATYHFRLVVKATTTSAGYISPVRSVVGITGLSGVFSGWPTTSPPMSVGTTTTVTTTLKTGTGYVARPVRLQRKLASATTWTTVHYGTTTSLGTYAAKVTPPSAGDWEFRLVAPVTATARTAYSFKLALSAVSPIAQALQLSVPGSTPRDTYRGNWSIAPDHYTFLDATGALVAVSRAGSDLTVRRVNASTFAPLSTQKVSITGWDRLGGVYAARDGYIYVLLGRMNEAEDPNANIVAVRRYDASWRLVGTAYLKGGASQMFAGIVEPFAASAPDMRLVGTRLVVHMGRSMFAGSDGVRHQSNLTFEVNTTTMTTRTFESYVGRFGTPYSSHSFRQLVTTYGTSLVTVDHGDAYPRGIVANVIAGYPSSHATRETVVMPFNGGTGDNFTGATLNAVAPGPSGVVILGSSIKHPNAPEGALGSTSEARNIYAVAFNPTTGASTVRWLTSYAASASERVGEPHMVAIGSDRFAVLFRVDSGTSTRLEYRLLTSAGTVLASRSYAGVDFSAVARPVLAGNRIVWLSRSGSLDSRVAEVPAYFTGLDITSTTAPAFLGH